MGKKDKSEGVPGRPDLEDAELVNELRELVKGGAVYEERRAPGKPATASRIVNGFSDEKRTPSRSGLPKWKATATEPGSPSTVRDAQPDGSTTQGTDPGLGPSVGIVGLGPDVAKTHVDDLTVDVAKTHVDDLTTVELPVAPVAPAKEPDPVVPAAKPAAAVAVVANEAEEVAPKTKSEPPKGRVLRREDTKEVPDAAPASSPMGRWLKRNSP